MGPRSGKTTSLGIPYVLSAPGAVIATSNKADLWAATAGLRAAPGSAVWVFDPQRITAAGQRWWWNPLAGLASVEAAHRLASHFVLTIDDESKRDIWGPAAQELLTSLLLAAAASRRTLREVSRWLDDPGSATPADLLDDAGYRALGSALRGAQHGAPETRDGIYQTARTAAKCLHDEEIMAWVTPPRGRRLPAFDPYRFPVTRDTLYLLTESRSAAAPLIAGLTDTTMRAGRRRAEQAGGRLDPPVVAMLDEAANICRIADLPDQYSHLGSRGMVPVTILQSYEQGEMVWGDKGHGRPVGRGDQEAHRRQRPLAPARPRCRPPRRPPRRSRPVGQRRRRPRQRADLLAAPADPRSRRHRVHRAGKRAAALRRQPPRPARPAALVRQP